MTAQNTWYCAASKQARAVLRAIATLASAASMLVLTAAQRPAIGRRTLAWPTTGAPPLREHKNYSMHGITTRGTLRPRQHMLRPAPTREGCLVFRPSPPSLQIGWLGQWSQPLILASP